MSEPRVSVVMSVYNGQRYLARAVGSVFAQTFTDWELVIVDDGSTDDSPRLLKEFALSDERVRVITQENAGLTRALIRGCVEARGEYIARHDADDWSEPTRLAKQVAQLDADKSLGFVSCATQYVGPNDEPLEIIARRDVPSEATRKLLDERQGPPAHGSVMFRHSLYEAVGGYRAEFYFGQDSDLWMRMAERAPIGYLIEPLYSARREPQSLSGSMGTVQREFGELGQACRSARRAGRSDQPLVYQAGRLTEQVRTQRRHRGSPRAAATMAYLIGVSLLQRGDRRGREYLWQAVRSHPLHWRSWVRLMLPSMNRSHTISSTTP